MRHVGDGPLNKADASELWKKLTNEFYPHGKRTIWGAFLASDNHYIGHASIRPRPERQSDWEIVYILREQEWGKGLATEIAIALVDYGFRVLGLEEVFATVDDNHLKSHSVLNKAGMDFHRYEFDSAGRFSVFVIRRDRWRANCLQEQS